MDDNDIVSYSFAQDSYEGEEGGSVTVTLNLNIAPSEEKVFTLQVLHIGGASMADYSGITFTDENSGKFTVTFSPSSTSQTINVTVADDDVVDPGELINIVVTDSAGIAIGSPNATSIKLRDTDATSNN